jgi:dolichol kinase
MIWQTLLLIASVAGLLIAIAGIRRAGSALEWHAEVSRKAVHVAIGLYAMALPLLFHDRWPVVSLILVSLALMMWLRSPACRTTGLGATIHSVERRSYGDVWLALAIGFVFIRSEGVYILYALPLAVITLSDAAAALTGTAYGRRRFAIEDGVKSWEGVVAFFAVTMIIAMSMLLFFSDVGRTNVFFIALTVAAFAATVEAVSWRGLDNLFVPIGTHLFLAGWLYAPPLSLMILTLAFFASVAAIAAVAKNVGMGAHASRATVIAAFVFLAAAGVYGAILPAAVLCAHLIARRRRPCRSRHGDLDTIATLAATGLIWFFIGETTGPSAINLYNLTVAGMLVGYLTFATSTSAAALPMAGVSLLVYFTMTTYGPGHGLWVRNLPAIASGSILLVGLVVTARPGWFDRWRGPRLALLSAVIPLATYASQATIQ